MLKFESRLGFDGDEGIYFDRTKPVVVDGEIQFEECSPAEVCDALQAVLEEILDRIPSAWVDGIVLAALHADPSRPRHVPETK